ncbi:phosphodiesterase [Haematococcus lacustris]|uniref:Phosphodiesterase n=1 Tax=Haematococcus lacustris TaxID=44745 RepID=A0A6A0AJ44_HAELA|nr:phosphodiesterase [Haematococcus lacustris]
MRLGERLLVGALLEVGRSPPDHLAPLLDAADQWGWDPFALNEATGGRPLSALCFALLKRHHTSVLHACKVDEGRLARFLIRIEDGYLDNPYVSSWLH